jgi:dienelactone hydrolase
MAQVVVVLFHSMFGLRPVELAAAERLRAAGHEVALPDLFDGAIVPGDLDAGFAQMKRIGWDTIVGRARRTWRMCLVLRCSAASRWEWA